MPDTAADCVVETEWLAAHLDAPDVLVMDGSCHMPGSGRDAKSEFMERRIPGAVFFDIDDICDSETDLPHMLPSTVKFASRMKKLGIGSGCRVVVYDTLGLFSAARVWWMLRVMGHGDVVVLNGGLPKWENEERRLEDGPPRMRTPLHFTPQFDNGLLADLDDVRANVKTNKRRIVDARPAGRFTGEEEEPRPGLRRGHIPGACNVPFKTVLNENGTLKSPDAIRAVFDAVGLDARSDVLATCGSGVTAAILALAMARIGNPNVAVYDGSWAEWGKPNGLPVAEGEA